MDNNSSTNRLVVVLSSLFLSVLFDIIIFLSMFSLLKVLTRPKLYIWALVFTGFSLLLVNFLTVFMSMITKKIYSSIQIAITTWTGLFCLFQLVFTYSFYYIVSIKVYIIVSLLFLFVYFCGLFPIIFLNEKASKWGRTN